MKTYENIGNLNSVGFLWCIFADHISLVECFQQWSKLHRCLERDGSSRTPGDIATASLTLLWRSCLRRRTAWRQGPRQGVLKRQGTCTKFGSIWAGTSFINATFNGTIIYLMIFHCHVWLKRVTLTWVHQHSNLRCSQFQATQRTYQLQPIPVIPQMFNSHQMDTGHNFLDPKGSPCLHINSWSIVSLCLWVVISHRLSTNQWEIKGQHIQ